MWVGFSFKICINKFFHFNVSIFSLCLVSLQCISSISSMSFLFQFNVFSLITSLYFNFLVFSPSFQIRVIIKFVLIFLSVFRYMYHWFSKYPTKLCENILRLMTCMEGGENGEGTAVEMEETGACSAMVVSLMAQKQVRSKAQMMME